MSKRFLTTQNGSLAITTIIGDDPDGLKLAKTMFELSRDGSESSSHFDSTVHTLDAIARGIPGHVPLVCRKCDETDLPAEQAERGINPTFRDAWEDTGTAVVVNMPKARVIHMDRIRRKRNEKLQKLRYLFHDSC